MIIKTNHTKHSFILLVVSVIVLISSFFSFTAAWFTNTKMFKMGGLVPTIDAKIYSGSSFDDETIVRNNDNVSVTYTLTPKSIGTYNNAYISFKSISTVDVYFRVKFSFKWADNSAVDNISSYVTFTLSDKFFSANSGAITDNAKITDVSGLYFKRNSNATITDSTVFNIIESLQITNALPKKLKVTLTYQVVQANSAGLASFGNNLPANWPVTTPTP